MGSYYIAKNGKSGWRLIWNYFENGKRRYKRVPEDQMRALGISPHMTEAEAREQVKALNANKQLEAKRQRALEHRDVNKLVRSAYLPPILLLEFEKSKVGRGVKAKYIWNAAKVAVEKLALDPYELAHEPAPLFDYFKDKSYSPFYVRRIISLLNRWLNFHSRKTGRALIQIESPSRYESGRIAEAYRDEHGKGKESDPLTPALLEEVRGKLRPDLWNWLYISVWLGLRPSEIDRLKVPNAKHWLVDTHKSGYQVLHVFQVKLVTVAHEKRWKRIPLKHPEQIEALKILLSGVFKRPLLKTLRAAFPRTHITTYGGRKGFHALMASRGEQFQNVSKWLGHRKLDMTYQHYMDDTQVAI